MYRCSTVLILLFSACATAAMAAGVDREDANQTFLRNLEGSGASSPQRLRKDKAPRNRTSDASGPASIILETGGHTAPPHELIFTPDGNFIVSAGPDKTIRFWDWRDGRPSRVVREEAGAERVGSISALAISPNGRLLVSGGYFSEFTGKNFEDVGAVRVRDLASGKLIQELRGTTNVVTSIAFSKDGSLLAAVGDTTCVIWRVSTGPIPTFEQIKKIDTPSPINGLAFAGDGSNVLIAYKTGEVQSWPVAGTQSPAGPLKIAGTLQGKPSPALVAVDPTNGLIAIGGEYDSRVVVKTSELATVTELELPAPFNRAFSFSPDGKALAATSPTRSCALIWDTDKWRSSELCGEGLDIELLAFHPKGEGIATASGLKNGITIDTWKREGGQLKLSQDKALAPKPIFNVAFSTDGTRLFWGGPFRSAALNSEEADRQKEQAVPFTMGLDLPRNQMMFGRPESVEHKISAGGYQRPRLNAGEVTVQSRAGGLIEIVKKDGEKLSLLGEHSLLELSPNGEVLYVANRNVLTAYPVDALARQNGKRLSDVADSERGPKFSDHLSLVLAVAASADGRLLATGSVDKTIKLWNAQTGELLVTIFAPTVDSWVLFTPQGYFAASQSGAQFLERLPSGASSNPLWREPFNRDNVVADALYRLSAVEAESRGKSRLAPKLKPLVVTESELRDRKIDEATALVGLAIADSEFDDGSRLDQNIQRVLQAIELRKSVDVPSSMWFGYYATLGTFYSRKADWENTFQAYKSALDLVNGTSSGDAIKRNLALHNMAQFEKLRGRPLAALSYSKEAANELSGHKDALPAALRMAEGLLGTGDNAEAEAYARVATTLISDDDNSAADLSRASTHYLLAKILSRRDLPEESDEEAWKAIDFARRAMKNKDLDLATRTNALAMLAQVSTFLGEREAAQVAGENFLKIALASESNFALQAQAYKILGTSSLALKEPFAAEGHFKRALRAWGNALGIGAQYSPDVARLFEDMGHTKRALGDSLEADRFFNTALDLQMKNGSAWPEISHQLRMTGLSSFALGNWKRSADHLTLAEGLDLRTTAEDDSENPMYHRGGGNEIVSIWLKALWRQDWDEAPARDNLVNTSFRVSQRAVGTQASSAIQQMAARFTEGEPEYHQLVRSRQELVGILRKVQLAMLSSRNPTQPTKTSEIEGKIAEIDAELESKYPKADKPGTQLSVSETQALLGDTEALVVLVPTARAHLIPEETFIWIITKSDARLLRSGMGAAELTRTVAALRCGLDASSWEMPLDQATDDVEQKRANAEQRTRAESCHTDLNKKPDRDTDGNIMMETLPFDYGLAYQTYKNLLGEAEDLLSGKSLLIVPTGALTTLPFHVLVTAPPPDDRDNRKVAWLAKRHPIAILPSVSSLKALRRSNARSEATKPYIGFGNPILDGDPGDANDVARSARARGYSNCSKPDQLRAASLRVTRAVAPFRQTAGIVDQAHLKRQAPLPETADEVCEVARDLNAGADVYLGKMASEKEIKTLSTTGNLAKYRILHFATHGTLSGQVTGTRDPGLIMTPPDNPNLEDDGYLSASEIAGLKLDADIVILSACNTAGGATKNAEALSGLARAFFYAQARSLVVSHWAVDSDATVALVTGAVRRLGPSSGLAATMQATMIEMLESGEARRAHPAFWAPFVVVGEGLARAD